jgi:hypothetical protein
MNIEFLPSTNDVSILVEPPQPSKLVMPQWYREITAAPKEINWEEPGPRKKHINLKSCTPFLDAMTSGFIQKTWADIYISNESDEVRYHVAAGPEMLGHRTKNSVPVGPDYHQMEFYWTVPWIPKVPKGYSVLMSQPNNRIDFPFTCLSAIIDADDFYHVGMGQFPIYLKKGFSGVIPAGTPMFQITPFKRDEWKSIIHPYNDADTKKREFIYLREFWGVYKNKFWKKKKYD